MQDYEMYEGDLKAGVINIYWDNINNKLKNSIIDSTKGKKYKLVSIEEDAQKYELNFEINDIDDIYDIVSLYIEDDKEKFKEIDKIKEYNKIKNINKPQNIKILLHKSYLKYFKKTLKDLDKNSVINSKIYFIKKVCELHALNEEKQELKNIITYFNNVISSNEYAFYETNEKDDIASKAIKKLDILIDTLEEKTEYRYGKDFIVNLKIN